MKDSQSEVKSDKKAKPLTYFDSIKHLSFESKAFACSDIGSITTLGKWLKEKPFGLS